MSELIQSRCPFWDCGWCYAPSDVETNSISGTCLSPDSCEQQRKSLDKKDSSMTDKTQNPAEIYLIIDSDGDLVWSDDPAPGEGMREEDATRYVREDIYLALKAQVEQLREVLLYADNKLYILTHNRKDVSPRLLTDADKGYKAVHEAVLGFKDNLNVLAAKRDKEIQADAYWKGYVAGGDDFRSRINIPLEVVTKKANELIVKLYPESESAKKIRQAAKGE